MMIRPCVAGVVLMMGLTGVGWAQEGHGGQRVDPVAQGAGQQGEAAAGQEGQRVAGFTVPDLGDGIEVRLVENANGVMYGVDVYRSDPTEPHRFADVTPLVRYSQTIPALEKIGTVDDLLKAVVNDARSVMKGNGLNKTLGETSECTRVIMGQERTGLRFDAVLSHDTLGSPDPITGHVECYAFEQGGRGVSVFLKIAESDGRASMDDQADIEALMAETGMTRVEPMTPYTYFMGGYPVRLVVGSRVVSTRQLNDHTFTSEVVMGGVRLSLYLTHVPEEDPLGMAFGKVDLAFGEQLRRAASASNGRLTLRWGSFSALPAGTNHRGIINAPVYLLSTPERDIYNILYKNLDGRTMLTGVLSTSAQMASEAHDLARIFVDGFEGGLYNASGEATGPEQTISFPEHRITIPARMGVGPVLDDAGEIEAMVFTVGVPSGTERMLESVLVRRPFTVMRPLPGGSGDDPGAVHRDLIEYLGYPVSGAAGDGSAEVPALPEPEGVVTFLDRGLDHGPDGETGDGTALKWIVSDVQLPAGGKGRTLEMRVQSCAVAGMVVSVVSPPEMGADALSVGGLLIGSTVHDAQSGAMDLGFGVLSYDPARLLVTSEYKDRRGERQVSFSLDGDLVDIYTTDPDSTMGTVPDAVLTAKYLRPRWDQITYEDEEVLLPAKPADFEKISIGGHEAHLFKTTLMGGDEEAGHTRKTSMGIAVIGFLDRDRYNTVVIKQVGHLDEGRVSRILAMFQSGQ